MKLWAEIGGRRYALNLPGHSIAIPLNFDGAQPNTYGVPAAHAEAYEGGGFVGDVRRGGPCNFETYRLTPHCNGTHTECVGHLTAERVPLSVVLEDRLLPARLATVQVRALGESSDSYPELFDPQDRVICQAALEEALEGVEPHWLEALVIRTDCYPKSKPSRQWQPEDTPFLTNEAMAWIREKGVRHLLLDLPSVDRLYDGGRLSNHRIFWGLPQGSTDTPAPAELGKTITEMVYAADELADDNYLLNLQVAAFVSDASPSQPILIPLQEIRNA